MTTRPFDVGLLGSLLGLAGNVVAEGGTDSAERERLKHLANQDQQFTLNVRKNVVRLSDVSGE